MIWVPCLLPWSTTTSKIYLLTPFESTSSSSPPMQSMWQVSPPIVRCEESALLPSHITGLLHATTLCVLANCGPCNFVPHDCANAPANGKAFCLEHCSQLDEMGVPTGLREFIRYCGASAVNFNKEGKSKVKLELAALAKRVKSVVGTSSAESQGVSNFLRNRDIANKEQLQELPNGDKEDCRKDIGEPLRLRRRSRGLLPFIAGLKLVLNFKTFHLFFLFC